MEIPAWLDSIIKILVGIILGLVPLGVARISRGGSLAETLRKQEESIRTYLKEELNSISQRLKDEEDRCNKLQYHLIHIHRIIRVTVDRLVPGHEEMPIEIVGLLARIDEAEKDFIKLPLETPHKD